ncbi:MAG TPA: hypothetical protein VMZ53_05280 [Kofleriaceae bacterium]|nr:hypothetical protein [Kofleriaceae bacterium]
MRSTLRFVCAGLLAACGGGGGFPDAKELDAAPTGTFSATWSVIDQNNQPLSCERIGGNTMTVLAHNKAFDGGSTQIFTCGTGMGTSQAVIAGNYDFQFELSSAMFGLLATATAQTNVAVPPGGPTPLAPLTFQVQATGAMELKLATGKPGGNCGAATNGAGITGVTITMNHTSDTSCAPITLTISNGATQTGGTYTIDCTTPVTFGCIESDQTITASGVTSDGYTMHITGFVGSTACWLNNDSVQVPPLDKTLQRTLNLAQQTTTGC